MAKIRKRRKKNAPPSYKGGHTLVTKFGYVNEYVPEHPNSDKAGMVKQHRLVMEDVLGRYLTGQEIVHHKDHCKTNNDPDNLEVTTRSDHHKFHQDDPHYSGRKPLTEKQVRSALQGRTTLEAAKLLKVNHNTLRNRFGHLLDKRRSPGGEFPEEIVKKVQKLANDPQMTTRKAAEKLRMCCYTLRRCCKIHKIQWLSYKSYLCKKPSQLK